MTAPISYTPKTAAEATGYSEDTIKRAIRSGDLKTTRPRIEGREVAKDSIDPADLKAWLAGVAR
ncbi:hypothetical protein [Demequina globuliformis]|uniref:hypothetical protein n=1 Tax=Demequina globuliformis TaxID=676202 RepID=UPI0007843351|nr:hypothetical protein [Demequina globuliformis]